MDAIRVAWRSYLAAHRFLFWAFVEWATKAIYWHKEASRELLVLKPRKPKDLYDAGYVLFAYDIQSDAWRGYWRTPDAQPGMPPAQLFEIVATLWGNVPFHEVEFSDMPEISFKVRAVSFDWCRSNCAKPSETFILPEAQMPLPADAVKRVQNDEEIAAAQAEAADQPVRH